jgi:hydroxymethylpyrimidine/phosphomethylpyrimidine kinase
MSSAALTIAGSDPSGGAGIQADLKTFHQFGVYGEAVITVLTVQNTQRVSRVHVLDPALVVEQIAAVIEDIPPASAKTGALGSVEVVEAVAAAAAGFRFPLVVDPVMISKHGAVLISHQAARALADKLLPQARLVTPNIPEAEELSGVTIGSIDDMKRAAQVISETGVKAVLVKGGHAEGRATDILYADGEWTEYSAARIHTQHTHGTGCTYSAAITAGLAKGLSLSDAVRHGKDFITAAILTAPGLGHGSGPVNHHAKTGVSQ